MQRHNVLHASQASTPPREPPSVCTAPLAITTMMLTRPLLATVTHRPVQRARTPWKDRQAAQVANQALQTLTATHPHRVPAAPAVSMLHRPRHHALTVLLALLTWTPVRRLRARTAALIRTLFQQQQLPAARGRHYARGCLWRAAHRQPLLGGGAAAGAASPAQGRACLP